MTYSRALLLLPLAAGMLTLAALDDFVIEGLAAAGVEPEVLEPIVPWLALTLATVGFVLLLAGLVSFVVATLREQRRRPYVTALKPFAAEFGRGVRDVPSGIEFELHRDGQTVEVQLNPRPGGGLHVRSSPPARQSLSWFRPPATPPARAATWREVERTERWQLLAELPAMARPLLADTALMEVVRRFFANHDGYAVTHTVSGMEIEAGLAPPEGIDAQVRVCVEIAFRLRRVNG